MYLKSLMSILAKDKKSDRPSKPQPKRADDGELRIWSHNSSRVESHIFDSNVPTFILSHDHRILDTNPAFKFIFRKYGKTGETLTNWFGCLENYKRVEKRHNMFFGDSILPMADRDRVVFISKKYGRMVFTKLMSPIFDQSTGRVVGWTVILNINSITKRKMFFEELQKKRKITHDIKRFAAAYDLVFNDIDDFNELNSFHKDTHQENKNILNFLCRTGMTAKSINSKKNKNIHALDNEPEFLRIFRHKKREKYGQVSLQNMRELSLQPNSYQGIACHSFVPSSLNVESFEAIYNSLVSGGTLTVGLPHLEVEEFSQNIKSELTQKNKYEELKYVLNHFMSSFIELNKKTHSKDSFLELAIDAGFEVISSKKTINGLYDKIVLRKLP